MRVLLDTNIVIDSFFAREPYNEDSDMIFDLVADKIIAGYITASSITDIYYLLRKKFNDADSRNKIRMLLKIFRVTKVTKTDCLAALDSLIPAFEDALVSVCADNANSDYIITRDIDFLKVPKTISPNEFVKIIELK